MFARVSSVGHALALLIVGWSASMAHGDNAIWIGPPSGNWSQPSNWSGGVVPNNGTPPGVTYDVFIDAGSAQASEVLVDQSFTINNLKISTSDALSIADGFNLSLAGSAGAATLSNMGALRAISSGGFNGFVSTPAQLMLSGGGTIELQNQALFAASGFVTNFDNRIVGNGNLVFGAGAANQPSGVIEARPGATGRLAVSLGGGATLFNSGTMRSSGGATLVLGGLSASGATYTGSGQFVATDASSIVIDTFATIDGSTLSSEGSGRIQVQLVAGSVSRPLLRNITNTGYLETIGDGGFELRGTLNNSGTVVAGALVPGDARIYVGSGNTITLSGGGELRLNAAPFFGTGMVINSNQTISGYGVIVLNPGVGSLLLVNQAGGILRADAPGKSLQVYGGVGAPLRNAGVIEAMNGGSFVLPGGEVDNTGGSIRAHEGSSINMRGTVSGGVISTTGSGVLLVEPPFSVRLRNVTNEGHLLFAKNARGTFQETIENRGSISMSTDGTLLFPPGQLEADGVVNLTGGGSMSFSGGVIVSGNELHNVDNTLRGEASIRPVRFVNEPGGIVEADSTAMPFQLFATQQENHGLMQARNGATLQPSTTNNQGGTIRALDGSTVQMNGSITGGTMITSPGGVIRRFPSDLVVLQSAPGNNLVLKSAGGGSFNNALGRIAAVDSQVILMDDASVAAGSFTTSGSGVIRVPPNHTATIDGVTNSGNLRTDSDGVLVGIELITNSGTIDCNGAIVVHYSLFSPLLLLSPQIRSGYASGAWNGPGINSTQAAANAGHAVGYAEASAIFPNLPVNFLGQQIDSTTFLARYTRYGDANLDTVVNMSDFNLLAGNFGGTFRHWYQGDFNFDTKVDLRDFNLLAAQFGLAASASEPTPQDWAALASVVPEPAGVMLLCGIMATAMVIHRTVSRSRKPGKDIA